MTETLLHMLSEGSLQGLHRETNEDIWEHLGTNREHIYWGLYSSSTWENHQVFILISYSKNMCFAFICGFVQRKPIRRGCSLFYPLDRPFDSQTGHRPSWLRCVKCVVSSDECEVWFRQFQVPVIWSVQPNNLKLPTSHSTGYRARHFSHDDGKVQTHWSHKRITEHRTTWQTSKCGHFFV